MSWFCFSQTKSTRELEFAILKQNIHAVLNDLEKLVRNNNYRNELQTLIVRTSREFSNVIRFFKHHLTDEVAQQFCGEEEVSNLRREIVKLKTAAEQNVTELNRKFELNVEDLRNARLENAALRKDIEEANLRLDEMAKEKSTVGQTYNDDAQQLKNRCRELEDEIKNSKEKVFEMQIVMEKARVGYENMQERLRKINPDAGILYFMPFDSTRTKISSYMKCDTQIDKFEKTGDFNKNDIIILQTEIKNKNAAIDKLKIDFDEINKEHEKCRQQIEEANRITIHWENQFRDANSAILQHTDNNNHLAQILDNLKTEYVNLQNRLNLLEIENLKLKTENTEYQATLKRQADSIEYLQSRLYSYQNEIAHLQPQLAMDVQNNLQVSATSIDVNRLQYQKQALGAIEKIGMEIRRIRTEIEKLQSSSERVNYLHLQELLIRCMVKLDNVESQDDQVIRDQRSKCMKEAQDSMSQLQLKFPNEGN